MRTVQIPKNALLDHLIQRYELKNSRALAKFLGVTQGLISKIRYLSRAPSADFILLVYDKTDLTIEQIRELIGEDNGSNAGKES